MIPVQRGSSSGVAGGPRGVRQPAWVVTATGASGCTLAEVAATPIRHRAAESRELGSVTGAKNRESRLGPEGEERADRQCQQDETLAHADSLLQLGVLRRIGSACLGGI